MLGSVNMSGVSQSKLDKIKSGTKTKEQIGGSTSKKFVSGKGGNYTVTEKEKKFEESGVARKKRNYVMYESKLGTEKERDLQKHDTPKPKAKPKPAQPKPRQEEKIVQKKKKKEYLDNYQYHETKDIKDNNPNKVSIVAHQRLGDIIGGSYEETSTTKYSMTDSGIGPKSYSSSTTKSSVKRDVRGVPTSTSTSTTSTLRSNAASRTLPATSRSLRTEVKQYSSSTSYGKRGGLPSGSATTTKTSSSRVASRSTGGSRGGAVKTSTRTFSAGRRH